MGLVPGRAQRTFMVGRHGRHMVGEFRIRSFEQVQRSPDKQGPCLHRAVLASAPDAGAFWRERVGHSLLQAERIPLRFTC